MTIELGHYGFMLDTKYCYIAISWELLIVATALLVGYKILKRKKNK